jgi:hypothetical protein
MQDEEIDDIIRDASNQHYPAYDDKAWDKMEHLLDKHLPQNEDKKKYLLLLLLFLLVDTGLFVVFFFPKKHSSSQPETITQNSKQNITAVSPVINGRVQIITTDSKNKTVQLLLSPAAETKIKSNTQPITTAINNDNLQKVSKISSSKKTRIKNKVFYSDVSNIDESNKQGNNNYQSNDKQSKNLNNSIASQKITQENTKKIDNISTVKDIQPISTSNLYKPVAANNNDTSANKQAATVNVSKQKKKEGNIIGNNFAFTISIGPGFSYVDDLGKTTFSYGAGIWYSFAKKFAIRTGFYVTKKIYSANPSDYNPPKWFWTYYPNLQKIDANCTVYEIPISISYDFGQTKKHNWFAAAGLASYLMKQEVYDYYSKDSNGQATYASALIDNKNKNIFSILTLSGGYQYNINKRISIIAEPYLEIPFNGIGFGNIKLTSGGLLFTAIIKPFAGK